MARFTSSVDLFPRKNVQRVGWRTYMVYHGSHTSHKDISPIHTFNTFVRASRRVPSSASVQTSLITKYNVISCTHPASVCSVIYYYIILNEGNRSTGKVWNISARWKDWFSFPRPSITKIQDSWIPAASRMAKAGITIGLQSCINPYQRRTGLASFGKKNTTYDGWLMFYLCQLQKGSP